MVFDLELTMHIDEDAVPARLSFNAAEENSQDHNLDSPLISFKSTEQTLKSLARLLISGKLLSH